MATKANKSNKTNKTNKTAKVAKPKMTFTAKNANELRKELNAEFRGFNHCVKFLSERWDKLAEIGEVDGLKLEHLSSEWLISVLNGTKDCKDGVLGRTTKGEFKARTMWTPGAVLDYLRKATRINWVRAQSK